MSDLLDRLNTRRLQVWEQMQEVANRGFEENRDMTGEETRQWEELHSELQAIDQRREDVGNGEKRAKAAEETMAAIAGKQVATTQQQPSDELAELRRFIGGETRVYDVPMPNFVERRTLAVTGVPMPTGFVGQLYNYLVDTSSVRQAGATIISTMSGEQMLVPRSTAEGSALWTAEGGTLTASDPTISSVTLGAFKLGKIIQISKELSTDAGFDLVGFLAQSAGRNIGIASNTAYVAGTGTTQPNGFVPAATVAITAATGQGSTTGLPTGSPADPFIDLYHAVIPQYRPRGSYMCNDAVIKALRKVKDSTGQYIWQPSLQQGQPDTVLGKPVYANPAMASFGVNAKILAFGDFSAYYIRDVSPLRFERSDEFAFGTDLVSFRALFRTDGALVDANAIKVYACAAS